MVLLIGPLGVEPSLGGSPPRAAHKAAPETVPRAHVGAGEGIRTLNTRILSPMHLPVVLRQRNGAGGEIRTHTFRLLRSAPLPVGVHRRDGAADGIRTHTERALNATPLPSWGTAAKWSE